MINSTWGVLGSATCSRPTRDHGPRHRSRAGAGSSRGRQRPYVVWPFIGSYTLRDTAGWVGGLFLDPVSYVNPLPGSLGVRAYNMVNYTSFRIGDYESLKDASIDPYLATRDAYLQYRANKAKQ